MRKPRRHGKRPDVSIVLHVMDDNGVDTGEWSEFTLTDGEFRQVQLLARARGMDVGEYLRVRIMSGMDTRRERAIAILSEKLRRSRERNTSSRS